MNETHAPQQPGRLTRSAVLCVLAGLLLVLVFLARGFTPWSFGLGFFLGVPLVLAGMFVYMIAVIRELRQQGLL
ncbi:MAG: hypothetical protein L0212_08270 [Acidobacteria bacterium]|nr:hypothetical protein [Acidobacteriota bacterium]